MDTKPTRFTVWWLPENKETRECKSVGTLQAAKRLAERVGGAVYERKNIRPSESAPGEWDYEEEPIKD